MGAVAALASVALIFFVLLDGFESMVLPRRVTRPYRFARLYYRTTWAAWRAAVRVIPAVRRATFLSVYGPLSLLGLFASWFCGLIVGFGLLHWSLGTVRTADGPAGFLTDLYLSGETFFTLGYGDLTPTGTVGRALAVVESGLGLGFLAVVIGYLPALYQAFSRREGTISLLDARAGSPPSAGQFLLRLGTSGKLEAAGPILVEWERWAAEVLESHLSFPVLSYYRSQHDNQSWLAALTVILDTCALLLAEVRGADPYQAQLTFAMARHAAVDLSMVLHAAPVPPDPDRLGAGQCARLREALAASGLPLRSAPCGDARLTELRGLYEPFVNVLAGRLLLALPPFFPEKATVDNWQTSAWMRRSPGFGKLPAGDARDDHFS
jgi:hypothetical protein